MTGTLLITIKVDNVTEIQAIEIKNKIPVNVTLSGGTITPLTVTYNNYTSSV